MCQAGRSARALGVAAPSSTAARVALASPLRASRPAQPIGRVDRPISAGTTIRGGGTPGCSSRRTPSATTTAFVMKWSPQGALTMQRRSLVVALSGMRTTTARPASPATRPRATAPKPSTARPPVSSVKDGNTCRGYGVGECFEGGTPATVLQIKRVCCQNSRSGGIP
jgi:hypothetical protein